MMLLDIPGVLGESMSTNGTWNAKIQIENMGYEIRQTTSNRTGTGLVSGGAKVEAMQISKQMDKSTPYLFFYLAKGTAIPVCYIRIIRAGQASGSAPNGGLYEAETYTLNNAKVISYNTSGSLGSGGLPMESWDISFTAIVENYVKIDLKGNPIAGGNAIGFDFAGAKPI